MINYVVTTAYFMYSTSVVAQDLALRRMFVLGFNALRLCLKILNNLSLTLYILSEAQ